MNEDEATARLRVAWATHYTADFESGPGDYHYEHCDFSELDQLLAVRDRQVKAEAWDEGFMDCANWWEIHHASAAADIRNPYLNGDNK